MTSWLSFGIALLSIIILFTLLAIEVIKHNHHLRKVPTRISVTGTRGKTSTTRILASILRSAGYSVLAKTTGTEASYILPDGSEMAVKRRASPNIIEQKKVVRMASGLGASILIAEQMSLHPENHRAETENLLKPHYTVLTNVRPDHLETIVGGNMDDIYINDIYKGSIVIAPGTEIGEAMEKRIKQKRADLIKVDHISGPQANIRLAARLATELGCDEKAIAMGIEKFRMDRGGLSAFTFENNGHPVVFINAFAVNDPESSILIIDKIKGSGLFREYSQNCLISFRNDRGDRTIQWKNYLMGQGGQLFKRHFFLGPHGRIVNKSIANGWFLAEKDPRLITSYIMEQCKEPSLIYGLANIGGMGLKLLDYWKLNGRRTELPDLYT